MPNERGQVHLLIPVGTQVVSRVEIKAPDGSILFPKGAVGVVMEAPVDLFHSYRVRFTNGEEASLRREDLSIRKQHQKLPTGIQIEQFDSEDLYKYIIYRCIVGSRAYGLDSPDSDTDRRGIYLPPAELQWSLSGVPEQLESARTQAVYWPLRKFATMALKPNPNVLECLYTPLIETATPFARRLLAPPEPCLPTAAR